MSIASEIERLQKAKADLKTAIKAKGVEISDTDTINAYADKVSEIQGGGIDYMPYMASVKFSTAAEELTENISLDLSNATTLIALIDQCYINFKKLTVKISSKCASFQNAFRANGADYTCVLEEIEIIGDTSGVTTFYNAFNGRKTLKRITGVIKVGSNAVEAAFGSAFNNCVALEEVRFAENCISMNISFSNSPNLTDETIDSTVKGLADLTDSDAQTLTVHPDVKARIESNSVWLNTITGKNWTLA